MEEEHKFWELIESSDYDKAFEIANKLSKNEESASLGFYLIGHYYYAIEEIKKAEQSFKKSIEIGETTNSVLAYSNYWLGVLYKHNTEVLLPDSPYDIATSKNFFRAALAFDVYPENAFIQLYHEIVRDKDHGIEIIEKAIKIYPNNIDFKFARIDYYYNLKNIEKVRELSYQLLSIENTLTYSVTPIFLSTFTIGDYFDKFDMIDIVIKNIDEDDSLLMIIKYEYARILEYTGHDKERATKYFYDCCLNGSGSEQINSFLFLADLSLRSSDSKEYLFREAISTVDATDIYLYLDGTIFHTLAMLIFIFIHLLILVSQ